MKNSSAQQPATVRIVVIMLVVIAVAIFAWTKLSKPDQSLAKKEALAQCLTDKGVKMYGAFWCPHCAAQKKDFESAFSKVTYVECALPDNPRDQTQACKDANIDSYPTWIFADGSRVSGEQTLNDLATKAGCSYAQ